VQEIQLSTERKTQLLDITALVREVSRLATHPRCKIEISAIAVTEGALRQLSREGHLLGLITGNGDGAAFIKLARGDLMRWFTFGAYASAGVDRPGMDLAGVRARRAQAAGRLLPAEPRRGQTERGTSTR
jgi:hypothetical protein